MKNNIKQKIIPAIDLIDGNCVRLFQGDYKKSKVYESNPLKVAQQWKNLGFKNLHIVDLDGAKKGRLANLNVIKAIAKECSDQMTIQVGGGIRDMSALEKLVQVGVERFIIGTIALENRDLLKELLEKYQQQLIISLDAKNGKLMTKGWLKGTEYNLFETAKGLEAQGVACIIYTDVLKDGTGTEPNYSSIEKLVRTLKIPVISAGGVSSLTQVKRLVDIGVEKVIVGKALYENQDLILELQKEAKC